MLIDNSFYNKLKVTFWVKGHLVNNVCTVIIFNHGKFQLYLNNYYLIKITLWLPFFVLCRKTYILVILQSILI